VPAPLLRHVHEEHREGDRPHRAGGQGPRVILRPALRGGALFRRAGIPNCPIIVR
jgi:hypothetical protein